jgi:hypothetical protein
VLLEGLAFAFDSDAIYCGETRLKQFYVILDEETDKWRFGVHEIAGKQERLHFIMWLREEWPEISTKRRWRN